MRQIFEELKDEQRQSKVENIKGYVFTRCRSGKRNGMSIIDISTAFEQGLERAKLKDSGITPHSFRSACITRWTDLGIPRDYVMLFSGHSSSSDH